MRWLLAVLLLMVGAGCSQGRKVTIITEPRDAVIRINGEERGRGRVVTELEFANREQIHLIYVARMGYTDKSVPVRAGDKRSVFHIQLEPRRRTVTFNVSPMPGIVKVDGLPITSEPVDQIARELEFTVDSRNEWTSYTATAERDGFKPAEVRVSWPDSEVNYTLELQPLAKDLLINSNPEGARVFIDEQEIGLTPLPLHDQSFPVDVETNEGLIKHVRLEKAGFEPYEAAIGWDNGRHTYEYDLGIPRKTVRIVSDPPGAEVSIEGKQVTPDESGAATVELTFAPINESGDLQTYTASLSKKGGASEWETTQITIGWDEGETEYLVPLKEVKTTQIELVSVGFERSDQGWDATPRRTMTAATKDVSEPTGAQPTQLTKLPKGSGIDTLAISPDGKRIIFTMLHGRDRLTFRSQMLVINTDGSGGADYYSDGRSLDITPSFSADGDQILFASNRSARSRLSIWSMSSTGTPGITQLTSGDTNDVWPSLDADPQPRLYYQALVDTRPDARIYMTQLGTTIRKDLTQLGGSQPRVSPRADTVVFTMLDENTGNRDLWLMSDAGLDPKNITNTPEIDEGDPSWSRDGSRLLFASDTGEDSEKHRNYDIWLMDLAKPDQPAQITSNGSRDDSPLFDPAGETIYFRSNRGGEWAIWKVDLGEMLQPQ